MKKKLFVVALMAALSTVGYAFEYTGDTTDAKFTETAKELTTLGKDLDRIYADVGKHEQKFNDVNTALDQIYDEVGKDHAKLENNISKVENMEAELKDKADKDYVDGKVTELGDHVREEMDTVRGEIGGVKAEVYENKEAIAANKTQIDKNTQDITTLQDKFAGHEGRISGLEKKVDNLDNKMNKGLSLMAAMNAVDFQNVETGEMALGAGIGHYGNAQSVALGVAYSPVEDLTVNAKYSVTAGSPDSFAVGAGATYKFKVGR